MLSSRENGGNKIEKVYFRSKEYGWHNFAIKFEYEDLSYKVDFNKNMFYRFFFNNLCLNDSCYECNYKALKSVADIRVGDFWGSKYKDDKEGVSGCFAFTEKGQLVLKEVAESGEFVEETVQGVLEEQMHDSPVLKKERTVLLKALKGKKSLKHIDNTTLFSYRLRCKIKSLLKRK